MVIYLVFFLLSATYIWRHRAFCLYFVPLLESEIIHYRVERLKQGVCQMYAQEGSNSCLLSDYIVLDCLHLYVMAPETLSKRAFIYLRFVIAYRLRFPIVLPSLYSI